MFDDGGTTSGENRQRVAGWPVSSGHRIILPFHLKKRIIEKTFSWNSSWNCYPLHCVKFIPPKFFSKTFSVFNNFSTLQISGGGRFRKTCRSRKKELNPTEITCKQSEPARTVSKIEKRKEFVLALCYE